MESKSTPNPTKDHFHLMASCPCAPRSPLHEAIPPLHTSGPFFTLFPLDTFSTSCLPFSQDDYKCVHSGYLARLRCNPSPLSASPHASPSFLSVRTHSSKIVPSSSRLVVSKGYSGRPHPKALGTCGFCPHSQVPMHIWLLNKTLSDYARVTRWKMP